MQMSLPQEDIYTGPPGLPRFCQDVDEHVGVIPGVVSVGAVAQLPFEGSAGQGSKLRVSHLRNLGKCRARTTASLARTTSER